MIPILYEKDETAFENNGLGRLRDCISCVVTEERNGVYELSLTYPVTGPMFSELAVDRLIKAKPNDTSELQLFKI